MTDRLRDELFQLIRCGMERELPTHCPNVEDCDELLRFAARQSIRPIVYHGLKRLHAPEEYLKGHEKAWLSDVFHSVQRGEALKAIRASLDAVGIPYILLKGAELRELYPDPTLRTSSDLDVLVREETLERAVSAIETDTDFRKLKRTYHDISMANSSVHLELHFHIKENAENIDRLLSRAWDYAVATGEGSRYAFTPEYQVFYILAHMCQHFLHGGLGIKIGRAHV